MIHAAPHVRIRANAGWSAFNPSDLWSSRELLLFLTWRDLKVRYAQTLLGAVWAILQPLSMMLLFTLLFSRLSGLAAKDVPYPLFAYAGLLPWTYFSNATSQSAHSLVANSHILTKVYFPRVFIPLAAVISCIVDLLIGLLMLGPLMVYYQMPITWHLLGLPLVITLTAIVAAATGVWVAAINVKYRDVRFALPFVIQLWLFASPVFYSIDQLPEQWRWVAAVNPVAGPIEAFRAALLGGALDGNVLLISGGSTLVLIVLAAWTFRRIEQSFADIV